MSLQKRVEAARLRAAAFHGEAAPLDEHEQAVIAHHEERVALQAAALAPRPQPPPLRSVEEVNAERVKRAVVVTKEKKK